MIRATIILIAFIFSSILFILSCAKDDYTYRVIGKVNTEDGWKDAVWYSDTLCFDYDTIYYTNSDGSVVRIQPPYEIEKLR